MKDRVGERYGALIVESFVGTVEGQRRWLCKCDCGGTITVITKKLKKTQGWLKCAA